LNNWVFARSRSDPGGVEVGMPVTSLKGRGK
jgi:hypothetical protein